MNTEAGSKVPNVPMVPALRAVQDN